MLKATESLQRFWGFGISTGVFDPRGADNISAFVILWFTLDYVSTPSLGTGHRIEHRDKRCSILLRNHGRSRLSGTGNVFGKTEAVRNAQQKFYYGVQAEGNAWQRSQEWEMCLCRSVVQLELRSFSPNIAKIRQLSILKGII